MKAVFLRYWKNYAKCIILRALPGKREVLVLSRMDKICRYIECSSKKMGPRTGRRRVWIYMEGTFRQCRNVYIMDVIISTPADVLILQVLFDHFEERAGSSHLPHSTLQTTLLMYVSLFTHIVLLIHLH